MGACIADRLQTVCLAEITCVWWTSRTAGGGWSIGGKTYLVESSYAAKTNGTLRFS
jgi:hypothetical protein